MKKINNDIQKEKNDFFIKYRNQVYILLGINSDFFLFWKKKKKNLEKK